jgi:hypothetical protein
MNLHIKLISLSCSKAYRPFNKPEDMNNTLFLEIFQDVKNVVIHGLSMSTITSGR